jgi:hypothetical protein
MHNNQPQKNQKNDTTIYSNTAIINNEEKYINKYSEIYEIYYSKKM